MGRDEERCRIDLIVVLMLHYSGGLQQRIRAASNGNDGADGCGGDWLQGLPRGVILHTLRNYITSS